MGALGCLAGRGRAFVVLNCDGSPEALAWGKLPAGPGPWPAVGLLTADGTVRAGINAAGLVVVAIGPGATTSRSVVTALAQAGSIGEAVSLLTALLAADACPGEGCFGLASAGQAAVVETVGGRACAVAIDSGRLARVAAEPDAGHGVEPVSAIVRHDYLTAFVEDLFAWMPALDDDDVATRCCTALRQPPIFTEVTGASLFIDAADRRVLLLVGDGPWHLVPSGSESP